MYILVSLLGVISMFVTPIALIVFLVQVARKKKSKTVWGIVTIISVFIFVGAILYPTPSNDNEDTNDVAQSTPSKTKEPIPETQTPVSETQEVKSETEIFADENDISIQLAKSIKTVLKGMKLTDKSRVGVFHYTLSDVSSWEQIDDWAEGQRYSAYMAEEHIFYFYVKDDTVVGVRDGHGNVFYSE